MTPDPPEDGSEFGPPEGPGEDELSDEIPDPEELTPFEEAPTDFKDINEFVEEEWSAATKARQRVRDVIMRGASPVSVARVAELADVSKPTAREELNELTEEGMVLKENSSNGNVYQRDPDWHRYQCLQQYLETSISRLESYLNRLQQEIKGYRETYGAESPEDLILSEEPLDADTWEDISHWRTALLDVEYIKTALQLDRLRRVEETTTEDDNGEEDQQLTSP